MPYTAATPCTMCGKPSIGRGRCENHTRGTTQRGYGFTHRYLRKRLERAIATGRVRCARCGNPIRPDEPWDLGHNDNDRSRYNGPEHQTCNRSTAAKRLMSK